MVADGGIARLVALLHRLEDGLLVLLLAAMIVLASSQIFLRNFLETGIAWGDPLLRLMVLWIGLTGAMVATRQRKHISIDVLSRVLPERGRCVLQAVSSLFTAVVCGVVAWNAVRLVQLDYEAGGDGIAGLPVWWGELIVPFCFTIITLRFLLLSVAEFRSLISGQSPA